MGRVHRLTAYTLLEVVLVLAIVVMLASMAIPRFAGAGVRYRADAAAVQLIADLSLAQRWARLTSSSQKVVFDVPSDTYELPNLQHPDHPDQNYLVALADEPYQAGIVSANFGGASEVTFDGYGVPSSGGTVVLRAGDEQRTIAVNADTGGVSMK
jgi:type II secretory pathway pseudopilin PulG